MNPPGLRFQVCIATTLLVLFVLHYAKGDGGIIRLREAKGPFSVTVFSSPEPTSGGLTDVSALIQERESGKVVLDADVRLALSPPDGSALNQSAEFCGVPTAATRSLDGLNLTTSARATRENASNKLLYSAPVELNATGNWKLHVLVSRGTDTGRFDCLLPVASNSGKLTGLLPYLLLPPLVVAAFALNQRLRRQSLQNTLIQSDTREAKGHPGFLPIGRSRNYE
jgi:hypothetical protein